MTHGALELKVKKLADHVKELTGFANGLEDEINKLKATIETEARHSLTLLLYEVDKLEAKLDAQKLRIDKLEGIEPPQPPPPSEPTKLEPQFPNFTTL